MLLLVVVVVAVHEKWGLTGPGRGGNAVQGIPAAMHGSCAVEWLAACLVLCGALGKGIVLEN